MDWKWIGIGACTCALGLGLLTEGVGAAHLPGCPLHGTDVVVCAQPMEAVMQPHSTEVGTPINSDIVPQTTVSTTG